eukprot:TRINITY_DN2855_c0_g1_i1.p1 TRINITY_DN2855_c0_g1~~TRINITY_DN2855_c0_g1_i1.p1  ORF type:complete len:613 (+),score=248.68 TRINITY_DN2855_c0_g1_i1:637-2475(+)
MSKFLDFNLDEAIIEEEHSEEERKDSEHSLFRENPSFLAEESKVGVEKAKTPREPQPVVSEEAVAKEVEAKKREVDREFEARRAEIDELYERKLQEVRERLAREKEAEKSRIEDEINRQSREAEERELKMFEEETRRRLTEEFEAQLAEEKARVENEVIQYRAKLMRENERKLQEYKDEVSKTFKAELEQLEKQLDEVRMLAGAHETRDPLVGAMEEALVKFREEQERWFAREVERHSREVASNLERRKEAELKKYNEMFNEFCRSYEESKRREYEVELKNFEGECEADYRRKIEEYRKEIDQQIALTKQLTENKIKEVTNARKSALKKDAEAEYGKQLTVLASERSEGERQHHEELRKIERELEEEFIQFKNTVIKNYDAEIADLEKHIADKRRRLINDVTKLNEDDFLRNEDTIRQYPDLLQIYRHIQTTKQEIIKKDLSIAAGKENKEALKAELAALNHELGQLKVALKEKEYKTTLEPLKHLEESLVRKLKDRERGLQQVQQQQVQPTQPTQHIQQRRLLKPDPNPAADTIPRPAAQRVYVSPKYSAAIPPTNVVGSMPAQPSNSQQTIDKLYSEIKELKTLISKPVPPADPKKEAAIKNILKSSNPK